MAAAALLFAAAENAFAEAKNVILMIQRRPGFNTIKATDYYTGSAAVYESFAVKGSMNTSSAGASGGYVGAPYDPEQDVGRLQLSEIRRHRFGFRSNRHVHRREELRQPDQ